MLRLGNSGSLTHVRHRAHLIVSVRDAIRVLKNVRHLFKKNTVLPFNLSISLLEHLILLRLRFEMAEFLRFLNLDS